MKFTKGVEVGGEGGEQRRWKKERYHNLVSLLNCSQGCWELGGRGDVPSSPMVRTRGLASGGEEARKGREGGGGNQRMEVEDGVGAG